MSKVTDTTSFVSDYDTFPRCSDAFCETYDNLLANNIAPLRNAINSYFGNGSYYKRRNGKQPITPDEQEAINNLFKAYGYKDGVVFDKYVDEPE